MIPPKSQPSMDGSIHEGNATYTINISGGLDIWTAIDRKTGRKVRLDFGMEYRPQGGNLSMFVLASQPAEADARRSRTISCVFTLSYDWGVMYSP